jgi:YidC/Oxa1 family membrane protein insertase
LFIEDLTTLHTPNLKLFFLPLFIVGAVLLLLITQPADAAPPDTPRTAAQIAQAGDVTLEKRASAEQIPLGQVVTYTVTIENSGSNTIEAELSDILPGGADGLVLQHTTISTTVGAAEAVDNSLHWTGSIAPGEEVVVTYEAIPPSTSPAGQTLENVAVLKFGETSLEASATVTTEPPSLGLWGSFVNFIAIALVFFDHSLEAVNIPYSFGFAIILFTVLVRLATFPLNMQQIKSSKAMQELQPKLKELQDKYKGDREKLAQEQMKLYREAGVNPLGGCLPMLVQMPIWFALYQSLVQLSTQGLLREGFFWIPSLAGPVSSWGGGIEWLWPFPPTVGWGNAVAYLVMPILLLVSQFYMQQLMTPPTSDPQQAQMQSIMKFMPLMFGYFALIVPSGLTLYWFTSNILGIVQHFFTKTQLDQAPAKAGASLSSPVPSTTPVPATTPGETSGENGKGKDAKSKRKSRRKR